MAVRPPTGLEIRDPSAAYWYARNVLKGRFPEGEAAIAKEPETAALYADKVVKGRWPEGEAAIATDPDCKSWYARSLRGHDPAGYEEFQLEHGDWVPDKVAEAATSRDKEATGNFRQPDEQDVTDPYSAFFYAYYVINGRFPAGEAAIASSKRYAAEYSTWLKKKDPEGYEAFHLEHGDWAPGVVAEAALAKARK